MFNKVYENVKKYLKENYKFLIILVLIFIILTYKLPFYILKPGGILDLEKKVVVENSEKLKGSFNLAYVSQMEGTIPSYLMSLIFKNWDIIEHDEVALDNESVSDLTTRNKLMLKSSTNQAFLVALKEAGLNYEIKNIKNIVIYKDEKAKTNLNIGDEIISVNGKKIKDINDIKKIVNELDTNTKVKLRVKKGKNEINKEAIVYEEDNNKYIGIMFIQDFEIKTDKKIEFNFKPTELGSSGGLMLTLDIYSKITGIDLTKGKKIAGTGTIDTLGNVGEIDGIKYKILGALKENVDVFFVPFGNNYKEAKKVLKEENKKLNLVPIKNFTEAKDYLLEL